MLTELLQLSWSRGRIAANEGDVMASGNIQIISARVQLDLWLYLHLCICVSVIEFFPLSFQCGRPLFFSTISECYTFCFHSYLASHGSLGPLCWSAVSPVLRAQGSRHFPTFKPAAVREHMSNGWMTHVTSAEAGRTSEELQLDSWWVSERTKQPSRV